MIGDFKHYYRAMRVKALQNEPAPEETPPPVPIPPEPAKIREALDTAFHGSCDFKIQALGEENILIAYLDRMVDRMLISIAVVQPVTRLLAENEGTEDIALETVQKGFNALCQENRLSDFNACVEAILSGYPVIFAKNASQALALDLQKKESRNLEEPKSESVARGSREGFTEALDINITLIRKKIKDSQLVFEYLQLGRQTKTGVAFCYINGLVSQSIIDEVRKRLKNIKTDVILESGYIEEFIEDAPMSIFPTVYSSERPDSICGKLLEGRVAILCDGTPFVLSVPNLFVDYLQFSEDYHNRWVYTGIIRFIRFLAFLIATMAPAYYIALVCFHQDVIPFKLLLTMSDARQGVPFPPLIEMILLTALFELIRESGLRMPKALSQAVSIVGGLIIGQAAVQAGIFSTPGVVIIAAVSISGFIVSKLDTPIFVIRILVMCAANSIGLLGVDLASLAVFIYMCSLKSFGVPYLAPLAPFYGNDMEDIFIRMPIWAILEKPMTITKRYLKKNTP